MYSNNRAAIEDFMRRYGYEEKEVEAAYHLRQAWDRFTEIYEDEAGSVSSPNLGAELFLQVNVDPHFNALWGLLGRRVLERPYPKAGAFGAPPMKGKGNSPTSVIHPSVPWPGTGHPEAMKMSCSQAYFHTSA